MRIKFTCILLFVLFTSFAQVPPYVPSSGLVGCWLFNGNANDATSNANNGTVVGATLSADRNSVANAAYYFNGSSYYIDVPNSLSLNNFTNNAMSVAFWGKVLSVPGSGFNGIILSKQAGSGTTQQGFNVAAVNNDVYLRSGSSGGPYSGSNVTQTSLGSYHHFVFTISNNVAKAYMDNVLTSSISVPGTVIGANTMNMLIGQANWTNINAVNFHGVLDELMIWDREITPCEIEAVYTGTILPVISPVSTFTAACPGQTVTFMASGANSYTWNGSTVTNSYMVVPTLPGTYVHTVEGSSGGLCKRTATISLLVQSRPSVSIVTSASTICSGSTVLMFATGANTYTWNTTSPGNAQVLTPTVTSIFSVTATNTLTGCTNTAALQITVNPQPTVTITSSLTTICDGATVTLQGNGANTYTWDSANTGTVEIVTPSVTTLYTVSGTNTLTGCTNSANITITVNPLPLLNIGSTQTVLCAGPVDIYLYGADQYSINGVSEPDTLNMFMGSNTNLFVIGTNTLTGCSNTLNIPFTVYPIPLISISGSSISCLGSPVTLTASGATNYTWSTTSTGSLLTVTPGTTTVYYVTGENALTTCVSGAAFTVTVYTPPTVSVSLSKSITCPGETNTLTAAGTHTYSWNTGFNGAVYTVTPLSGTNYTVTGTNTLTGCKTSNIVYVPVNSQPSVIAIASSATICAGQNVTLSAVGANSYTWSTGAIINTLVASPGSNTNYSVTGQNTITSCKNSATLSVGVVTVPVISANGPSVVCRGETAILNVSGTDDFLWSNGLPGTQITVTVLTNSVYTVMGTATITGCSTNASVSIIASDCVGLPDPSTTNNFIIYPNPASAEINYLQAFNGLIQIVDLQGRVVLKQHVDEGQNKLSIQSLEEGTYVLIINQHRSLLRVVR
jgi:hypothetical protein